MIPVFRNSDDIQKNKKLYLNAIEKVLDSSQLVLGQEVSLFEEEFSAFVGVEFGVGVNSGTDALFLALKALGIKPGDEVITVANTAVPTVSAIRATGAKPVFVDVSLEDGLIDASKIE